MHNMSYDKARTPLRTVSRHLQETRPTHPASKLEEHTPNFVNTPSMTRIKNVHTI